MPLIEIKLQNIPGVAETMAKLRGALPEAAAKALSCPEGQLKPEDIMIEFGEQHILNQNGKDVHVRVWAQDYPSRRENLRRIRKRIEERVLANLPHNRSYYVWVLLAETSYGSDTEDD